MTDKRKKLVIPKFKTIEEEAKFWDTHSMADYWPDWKPVKVEFAKNLTDSLNVRFEPEDLNKIREEAQKKGVGPTTLVRIWIKEKLYA